MRKRRRGARRFLLAALETAILDSSLDDMVGDERVRLVHELRRLLFRARRALKPIDETEIRGELIDSLDRKLPTGSVVGDATLPQDWLYDWQNPQNDADQVLRLHNRELLADLLERYAITAREMTIAVRRHVFGETWDEVAESVEDADAKEVQRVKRRLHRIKIKRTKKVHKAVPDRLFSP